MKSSFNVINAIVISALALVVTNPAGAADSRSRAEAPRETARMAPAPRAMNLQQATQRMIRQLRPEQALRLVRRTQTTAAGNPQYQGTTPKPPKYEVADCTGSNGVPKACCSYTPGDSGSSCDMFILLCDEMSGTTSSGGSNAATCSGEGVLE